MTDSLLRKSFFRDIPYSITMFVLIIALFHCLHVSDNIFSSYKYEDNYRSALTADFDLRVCLSEKDTRIDKLCSNKQRHPSHRSQFCTMKFYFSFVQWNFDYSVSFIFCFVLPSHAVWAERLVRRKAAWPEKKTDSHVRGAQRRGVNGETATRIQEMKLQNLKCCN